MSSADRLRDFVLFQAQREPVSRRITLYRDVAEVLSADAEEQVTLRTLADDLQGIEHKHQQLVLNLQRGEA